MNNRKRRSIVEAVSRAKYGSLLQDLAKGIAEAIEETASRTYPTAENTTLDHRFVDTVTEANVRVPSDTLLLTARRAR